MPESLSPGAQASASPGPQASASLGPQASASPAPQASAAGGSFVFTDASGRPILVRRVIPADAEAMIAFIKDTDAESTNMTREPGEFTMAVETERRFLAHVDGRPNALFLTAWDGAELIGTIDFHGGSRRRTAHTGEFGLVVRRSHWGRGIGGCLLNALLAWARTSAVVSKIKLRVRADNHAAIALYRARGFVEEGRFRAEMVIDGVAVDVLAMAWFPVPIA